MLRENNVVHRDLKPQNILLVENNENSLLKIADFGFAKFLQPSTLAETLCGSPLYMAPEVMQAQKYDAKNRQICGVLVSFYINLLRDIHLLMGIIRSRKLLQLNSVERLTVEEFVNHPFLSEHAPERTVRRTPSDTRDGFPFINSSPTRPANQNSQEDCMPFPLDDESSGQDENPIPGSADMSDAMDQPPSDYLMRIRLLEQYALIVAELVKEEIKGGRHLEAFSIQLVVLATWKQAIHVCSAYAASMAGESPSQDIPMKGFTADASHLLATSQVADDACMQVERQFLAEVEYAEELAGTVGQIADATEMPDAIEIVFQSALQLGRRGGVDEMMGNAAVAISLYMRAVSMLRFLLIEAPFLALNPPLTLTRSDRHRLRTYIEALNTRLGQLQCQRH
ncbi:hypothetical protein PR202_ga26243 [Eleusine coracana subsp. coracana]|uniref:Protein kinase domain-containing protein n=1 Tax=Eleusine coracana subsp. coracana TaxID=191504 RepID=A0AAV5DC89_ELECO|nr:hypothetical protein PR202_ga26243 [Eleusine coracana subsp. coracana]